ncbi:hypothetical protein [Pseudomonas fulva]|nr:hypothetical protein [Pseudomonas fulva]MBF8780171.1 hypothetical protein [Pseudomonas fulva]
MRWLFLLLLVLNVVYYIWSQQQAPVKAKEVASLSLYKGSQQEIRLLRELGGTPKRRGDECLVLGGLQQPERLEALRQRLLALDINASAAVLSQLDAEGAWLLVARDSERLLDEAVLASLSRDFKDLKHKIILCEGIATGE